MRVANKPASESAPGTHRPIERPLYEPPRIRSEEEGKRPTSWLEFFFDLVFVVAVDQLARRLQHGVTGHGTLIYLALYGPIWWAWVGFVLYTDRFGTDDLSDRLMTLVQIGAALALAAAAAQATADRAPAFAIAYGAFRLILAARYAIAAHYVLEARRECTRQSIGFALAAIIWIGSAAMPAPWRFWMWGVGFGVDLLTPFAAPRMHEIVPPDAQLPLAAGVAAAGIAVGNVAHDADAPVRQDSLRWLVCGMVALCYVAHAVMHIAYAKAGAGRRAWLVVARKIPTIAAALLLGALGAGLSAVGVAGLLASAAGAQVLWNIWDRAHADARDGEDPGPGLARASSGADQTKRAKSSARSSTGTIVR